MKFLLDTNVLSDARRGGSPVDAWLSVQLVSDLAVSAITLLELDVGVRLKERRDPVAGSVLRHWLEDSVRPMFEGRVLAVDGDVAREAARLQVPDPMPAMDRLIAATALRHQLTLVTRNQRDMARSGVALLDPWED